jgi:hypothetical protein
MALDIALNQYKSFHAELYNYFILELTCAPGYFEINLCHLFTSELTRISLLPTGQKTGGASFVFFVFSVQYNSRIFYYNLRKKSS